MTRQEQIRAALEAAFQPTRLEILNESHQHAHHNDDARGGESHFRIRIAAPELAALSRLDRHRAVHAALGKELTGAIHALALEIEG